jgi:hypothetical protein
MQEVLVPTAFAQPSWRRPVIVIAAWLIVLQGFLTGIATAQAGAAMADPLAAAVICHGTNGGDAGTGPALPDAGAVWHLCCSYCLAAVPALPPPSAHVGPLRAPFVTSVLPLSDFIIVAARKSVRAGSSQAPPDQA